LWMAGSTRSPVPTYLWGEHGSGKTHLLKAVAAHIQGQGALVGWMDASTTQAADFNPEWEVLVLDDVQLFSAVQQHAAFNWFVNAATPGGSRQPWVLAAGLLPPQDLHLREDLRTRLGWGHVFHLELLDDAQRREVLVRHAQALGMNLNKDLLDYLLTRFSRDLGHLMDLLQRLDHFALQTQRPLTIPLLRAMLDET
jgi:DnaA-homolog protein